MVEAVAARLGNLLALLVEKELVVESFRLLRPEDAADVAGETHGVDEVLPRHLVVDAERRPAHGPVRLPLQLAMTARDRNLREPSGLGLLVEDRAGGRVAIDDRHLEHLAGDGRDRQEGAVGGAPLRPKRRQDHVADRLVMLKHPEQRLVEAPGRVAFRRREKLVFETESVEERPEPRIVVVAEARVIAEGIGNLRERLAEMLGHHLLVGDVARHLAQTVHIVREADQPRRDLVLGEHAEGMAHHGGAGDLAEGADMRQARGTVTGLEDDGAGRLRDPLQPAQDLARLLEGPGLAHMGVGEELGIDFDLRGPRPLACRRVSQCRTWGCWPRPAVRAYGAWASAGLALWVLARGGLVGVDIGGVRSELMTKYPPTNFTDLLSAQSFEHNGSGRELALDTIPNVTLEPLCPRLREVPAATFHKARRNS